MIQSNHDQPHPATQRFQDLIFDGGTPAATCQLCQREHFNDTGEWMDPGELDDYLGKRAENPDKYHGHDGQIHIGTFAGLQVVAECPCNRLADFERLIWGERRRIADYLCDRARAEHLEAATMHQRTEHLPELVGPARPEPPVNPPEPAARCPVQDVQSGNQCLMRDHHDGPCQIEGEPEDDRCPALDGANLQCIRHSHHDGPHHYPEPRRRYSKPLATITPPAPSAPSSSTTDRSQWAYVIGTPEVSLEHHCCACGADIPGHLVERDAEGLHHRIDKRRCGPVSLPTAEPAAPKPCCKGKTKEGHSCDMDEGHEGPCEVIPF